MNQTQDVYNGLGQLTGEYQSVSGAVDTGSTPEVEYGYSSIATGSNMISMTYPNGRVLDYGYDGNALDEAIGRIDSLSDAGGSGASADLVEYQYQGLSTIVGQTENGTSDSSISISNTLTPFGQVAETQASSVNGGTLQDFQYGYDPDGNVLYKNNVVDSSLSELYTYDSLNRLTSLARGTLNDGDTAIATASALAGSTQSWDLDALGNQISTTTDGTAVDKTQNSQNELTGVGSSDLSYDNDGNTLIDNQGHHLLYNAWNELVTVKNAADTTTLAAYTYDPAGDRITETHGGTTTDVYFSNQGQVLEERQGGVVTNQYVWNIDFVNDLLLRDDNSTSGNLGASDSGLGVRLYALHDANYNVTVLVNTSGDAVQDFVYSAYGVQTVINPSTGGATTDAYSWIYGFQGGRYDPTTGLYHFGAPGRDYNPVTGTWMEQDPAGYVDGSDVYQFVDSTPLTETDALGEDGQQTPVQITITEGGLTQAVAKAKGGYGGSVPVTTKATGCGNKDDFTFKREKIDQVWVTWKGKQRFIVDEKTWSDDKMQSEPPYHILTQDGQNWMFGDQDLASNIIKYKTMLPAQKTTRFRFTVFNKDGTVAASKEWTIVIYVRADGTPTTRPTTQPTTQPATQP